MKPISFFVITTLISFSHSLKAGEWKLEKLGQSVLAKLVDSDPSKSWSVMLDYEGQPIEIIEYRTETPKKDIALLIYDAGTVGTYDLVKLQNAAVLDTKNKKLLGNFPWKYEFVGKRKEKVGNTITQPEWIWKEDGVKVIDKAFLSGGNLKF